MTNIAFTTVNPSDVPRLCLLPETSSETASAAVAQDPQATSRPLLRLVPAPSNDQCPVLVAGADRSRRASVLEDLSRTMPQGTSFQEASAFWEVLAQAPGSRMVILSGDLEDGPSESLMQAIGNRHPGLPVVSLDSPGAVRALG